MSPIEDTEIMMRGGDSYHTEFDNYGPNERYIMIHDLVTFCCSRSESLPAGPPDYRAMMDVIFLRH